MANTTYFGWETPDDTDLVKDGAAAIRTLGSAIDTSLVDLKGGTTDQVLAKNSNTDMDFKWVAQDDSNAIQNAIVDAKGDIVAASANDTPARLAVGTNGHVLIAASGETTGLKWGVDPTTDVITTAGDLLYGTAADTVARLGIGTAGQVLKVNSGATAPEWGTAASAGGWTELASGSIAASATGFDLQSIDQTYRELVLVVNALSVSNGAGYNNGIRCNNDSGTNYSAVTVYPSAVQSNAGVSSGIVGANEDTGTKHTLIVKITNYTDTTSPKLMVSQFNAFDASKPQFGMQFWHNSTPAAIDRLQLVSIGDTYDGGTYKLYGVK